LKGEGAFKTERELTKKIHRNTQQTTSIKQQGEVGTPGSAISNKALL